MKLNLSNPSLGLQSVIMLTAIGLMSGCTTEGAINSDVMTQPITLSPKSIHTTQIHAATPDKISIQPTISATSPKKESTPMTTMVIENTELMAKGIKNKTVLKSTSQPQVTTLAKTDQLMLDKIIRPQKRVFHYATGQKSLSNEDIQILKQHAKYLLQNPTLSLNINGYTDARGSEKANLNLSKKRAEEVMHQLETMGINPSRIHILAWGESHPVKSIHNYAENRRIELEYRIQKIAANDTSSPHIH
jgi:peptidoglycan-associated lipoprotein